MSASNELIELRVLHVPYERVHFLLNRSQCTASLFASDVIPLKSSHLYLRELIDTGDGRLLFFDLNRFFCDTFRLRATGGAQLALVGELSVYSGETRQWLQRHVLSKVSRLGVSADRLAFRIPSNTAMQTLTAPDLSPHAQVVQKHLTAKGILAVHLAAESFGFFIDLDQLLRSKLLFSARSPQEAQP